MSTNNGTLAVNLFMFSVAAAGKTGITQNGTIAITGKMTGAVLNCVSSHDTVFEVKQITGVIRGDGGAIFQFHGMPKKTVVWSLTVGSGAITPFSELTDDYGFAWARYDAGGYTGDLEVQVDYGT